MAKYVYPAIFAKVENGLYFVDFPDVPACFTQGEGMAQALEMAEDILCLRLYDMEKAGEEIPEPSEPKALSVKDNETVSFVHCDTVFYKRYYESKSVKKTLTIPGWLNDAATAKSINFSQTLQNALLEQLNLA
ncbi:MAG: type II toxin-antitoxin system HicB family antitoxin [Oscillospiraceae bacterium]|nr:type II toxin-antitoxin system HicB family antitoxin [Oscillospiraceae bacterium]